MERFTPRRLILATLLFAALGSVLVRLTYVTHGSAVRVCFIIGNAAIVLAILTGVLGLALAFRNTHERSALKIARQRDTPGNQAKAESSGSPSGSESAGAIMFCNNGHQNLTTAKFCSECGTATGLAAEAVATGETVHRQQVGASAPQAAGDVGAAEPNAGRIIEAQPATFDVSTSGSRRTRFWPLAVIAVLAIVVGGVFGVSALKDNDGSTAAADGDMDKAACRAQIGTFVDALQEINSRLDVGMNVGELSTRLGTAKVAYDKLDPARAVDECGGAAAHAEDAYNAYLLSVQAWQECIDDTYCTPTTPKMQRQWAKAGRLLASIDNALSE